ncbi:MAG: glycosyltransferase [Gammaproteobacteria bacterium]|nr:glycosyltransferase [Gammaproteobacteria bacterium]
MPLKVAHLTDSISNNGVTRVLLTLTRAMAARGVDTTLLIFRPAENKALADQFECEIKLLEMPADRPRHRFWNSKWDVLRFAGEDSALVDDWARENSADFVFIHGRPILRFFRTRTAHAVVAHNTKSKMFLPGFGSPRRPLIRSRVHRIYSSQPVISVSEGIRQDFIDEFAIRPDSIETIYNPIDIDQIRQLAAEDVPDLPARPFFVAAGSARRVKRYDILIRAFARCGVDADLVILGQGEKLDEYRKLANRLGVGARVHLPGYRPNPYAFFRRALALVVSSDYEGLPTGIIEALACGIPVVSTDCPSGPREILQDDMADFLVPVRNVPALANAMQKVVRQPYTYPEELFAKFEPSRVADAYQQFAARHL